MIMIGRCEICGDKSGIRDFPYHYSHINEDDIRHFDNTICNQCYSRIWDLMDKLLGNKISWEENNDISTKRAVIAKKMFKKYPEMFRLYILTGR